MTVPAPKMRRCPLTHRDWRHTVGNRFNHCFTFVLVIFEQRLCSQLLFKRDYAIKLYSFFLLDPSQRFELYTATMQIKLTFSIQNETCEPMRWGVNVSHNYCKGFCFRSDKHTQREEDRVSWRKREKEIAVVKTEYDKCGDERSVCKVHDTKIFIRLMSAWRVIFMGCFRTIEMVREKGQQKNDSRDAALN